MVGKSDEDLSLADFVFTSRSHSINGLKFYLEKNNREKRKCSNAMYSYCTARYHADGNTFPSFVA